MSAMLITNKESVGLLDGILCSCVCAIEKFITRKFMFYLLLLMEGYQKCDKKLLK